MVFRPAQSGPPYPAAHRQVQLGWLGLNPQPLCFWQLPPVGAWHCWSVVQLAPPARDPAATIRVWSTATMAPLGHTTGLNHMEQPSPSPQPPPALYRYERGPLDASPGAA